MTAGLEAHTWLTAVSVCCDVLLCSPSTQWDSSATLYLHRLLQGEPVWQRDGPQRRCWLHVAAHVLAQSSITALCCSDSRSNIFSVVEIPCDTLLPPISVDSDRSRAARTRGRLHIHHAVCDCWEHQGELRVFRGAGVGRGSALKPKLFLLSSSFFFRCV